MPTMQRLSYCIILLHRNLRTFFFGVSLPYAISGHSTCSSRTPSLKRRLYLQLVDSHKGRAVKGEEVEFCEKVAHATLGLIQVIKLGGCCYALESFLLDDSGGLVESSDH